MIQGKEINPALNGLEVTAMYEMVLDLNTKIDSPAYQAIPDLVNIEESNFTGENIDGLFGITVQLRDLLLCEMKKTFLLQTKVNELIDLLSQRVG